MFWERFYELCCKKGSKPNPIAQELGISSGVLTKWKNNISYPNGETLIRMADYFECSIDYLVGREDTTFSHVHEISRKDSELLDIFHALSKNKQEELLDYSSYLLIQEEKKRKETLSPSADAEDNARLA